MAEFDILGKALSRGKAKGEILDKEYLLVEMQKIANELGEVLSGYTAADQGILLFVLRTAEKNMEAAASSQVRGIADLLEKGFGCMLVSASKEVRE